MARWILTSLLTLVGCGGLGVAQYREASPAPSVELRFVDPTSEEHAHDLEGLDVALSPGAILRAEHIASIQRVHAEDGRTRIVLVLHDAGRTRALEATRSRGESTLGLVVGGVVVATPRLRGVLDQSELAIEVGTERVDEVFERLTRETSR